MQIQRNHYIDILRGIAALAVIGIHTAFWSGEGYVPMYFRSITLAIDVPFFFFLSGWGSRYSVGGVLKVCRSLGKIWIKWIYFVSIVGAFCALMGYQGIEGFKDLINNYMFNASFGQFRVLAGSLWFMQYYFLCLIFNTVIIGLIVQSEGNTKRLEYLYLILLGVSFVWITYNHYFFGLDRYIIFYSFFWMLGRNRENIKIRTKRDLALSLFICLVGFMMSGVLLDIPLINIQAAKFPPSLMYGFYSMIAIIFAIYLEGKLKDFSNGFLEHIGRNAIFYFFAQGLGSSLIYYIVEKIELSCWLAKWGVTYLCNIIITILIAEGVAYTYIKAEKSVKFFSKKMSYI